MFDGQHREVYHTERPLLDQRETARRAGPSATADIIIIIIIKITPGIFTTWGIKK